VDVKWDRCVDPTKEQKQILDLILLSQLLARVIVAPPEVPLDRVAAYEANNFGSVVMRPMWHHAMVSRRLSGDPWGVETLSSIRDC
jgi:hypothetical protein